MLILAREVVFAARPPDTVEHFKRLAVGVQRLALTAREASRSQDRLDPVLLVLFGDCQKVEEGMVGFVNVKTDYRARATTARFSSRET